METTQSNDGLAWRTDSRQLSINVDDTSINQSTYSAMHAQLAYIESQPRGGNVNPLDLKRCSAPIPELTFFAHSLTAVIPFTYLFKYVFSSNLHPSGNQLLMSRRCKYNCLD